jgi:hypothetical protein
MNSSSEIQRSCGEKLQEAWLYATQDVMGYHENIRNSPKNEL